MLKLYFFRCRQNLSGVHPSSGAAREFFNGAQVENIFYITSPFAVYHTTDRTMVFAMRHFHREKTGNGALMEGSKLPVTVLIFLAFS